MRQRLMRMLLLAAVGVVGRQIQKRFQQQKGVPDGHGGTEANPTAAPFEAHVEGDSVHYEASDPTARDPHDSAEPFAGNR